MKECCKRSLKCQEHKVDEKRKTIDVSGLSAQLNFTARQITLYHRKIPVELCMKQYGIRMIDNSDQVNSLQILHMPWCGTQVKILIRSNKILFPCIPCLCRAVKSGNFPTDYFIHLALLITAMRHLHSVNVDPVSMEST